MPDNYLKVLGRFHLASEVVNDFTLRHLGGVHPVGLLALLGGQACDVLLDERAESSLIKVADEQEGVVGGIGGALFGNLHNAVQAHLLQILDIEGLVAPAAVADDVLQRVAHGVLGHEVLVLELGLHQVHGLFELLLIGGESGELEVNELHHGLQILDGAVAADAVGVIADVDVSAGLLTGKRLLEIRVGEVAQTSERVQATKQIEVGPVVLSVERLTTALECAHRDFVLLEVGLLEHDACAIAQLKDLVAEQLVLALLNDFTLLGQLGHQGLVHYIVHIWGDVGTVSSIECGLEAFNSRIYSAVFLLVKVGDHQILAIGVDEFGDNHVDHVNGDVGSDHSCKLEILLYRGEGFAIKEVAAAAAAIDLVLHLVALVIPPLH